VSIIDLIVTFNPLFGMLLSWRIIKIRSSSFQPLFAAAAADKIFIFILHLSISKK